MNNRLRKNQLSDPANNVISFPPATRAVSDVVKVGNIGNYSSAELFTFTISSNDMIHFGLAQNDTIIYRQEAQWSNVRTMQICVVEIQGKKIIYAAIVGNNNEVFLCTSLGIKPEVFNIKSVKLLGIAIAFQRDLGGAR